MPGCSRISTYSNVCGGLGCGGWMWVSVCICVSSTHQRLRQKLSLCFHGTLSRLRVFLLEVKMRKSFLPSQVAGQSTDTHPQKHTHTPIHAWPLTRQRVLRTHTQANTHLSCCSWLWKGQVVRCHQDQSSRCQRTCPNAYRLHTRAHKSLWEGHTGMSEQ